MIPDGRAWIEAGDPTILGWFTSAGYLLAALFAFRVWHRCRFSARIWTGRDTHEADRYGRLATWWMGVTVLMLLLGLNKELDLLQKLVTVWGRAAAISLDLYGDRRMAQRAFIALLVLLSVGAGVVALHHLRGVRKRVAPALFGVALVLAYAVLRATVFNMKDARFGTLAEFMWVVEVAGILLVLWCAVRDLRVGVHRP
jgi:hypothetical protein